MMEKVFIVTGNSDKLMAARRAFENTGIQISRADNRFKEFRVENSIEVARHTVEKMREFFEEPVVREDHSLFLEGLDGIPGPYISYFDRNLPVETLLELLEGRSRKGYSVLCAAVG